MTQKNPDNGIDLLLKIMNTLRSPGGCPWDAEQTPESLTPYIMEEACELIDAIESGNDEETMDELGDLLLQVVFQAQIFQERGTFTFNDVAHTISTKLIRRHPHVFEEGHTVKDNEELHRQWDEIKRSEKNNKPSLTEQLPKTLPALQKAQKLISKSYKRGQADKLPVKNGKPQAPGKTINEEELGLMLMQITHCAHEAGLDAETALRKCVIKLSKCIDGVET
jgi:uncharacterized protein YabN with tetrapyrrole methylase and pyrophosphatase domain